MRWSRLAALLLLLAGLAACAAPPARRPEAFVSAAVGRSISAIKVLPAPINLYDHGVEVLSVADFAGTHGSAVVQNLASQLAAVAAFEMVDPQTMSERLMNAGLAVEWDSSPTILPWVGERTGVDAVIVGRVEELQQEGIGKRQETLALVETGEYVFVLNEDAKLSLQERMDYQKVPLFCRVDRGRIRVSYRIWHARYGDLMAQREASVEREVPSYCYRGELSPELKREAEARLRRRLFADVNAEFLRHLLPRRERVTIRFEALPRGAGALQVQRNELAIVYASRGDWAGAVELWQECACEGAAAAAVDYNLAMAYEATARLALAEERLEAAMGANAKPLYQAALHRVRAARAAGASPH